jgi:hypothetical protein
MITVALLKPLKVSSKESTPERNSEIMERSATISGENFPHTKSRMVTESIIIIKVMPALLLFYRVNLASIYWDLHDFYHAFNRNLIFIIFPIYGLKF